MLFTNQVTVTNIDIVTLAARDAVNSNKRTMFVFEALTSGEISGLRANGWKVTVPNALQVDQGVDLILNFPSGHENYSDYRTKVVRSPGEVSALTGGVEKGPTSIDLILFIDNRVAYFVSAGKSFSDLESVKRVNDCSVDLGGVPMYKKKKIRT